MASEEDHIRTWLARHLAGCRFASLLTPPGRLAIATFFEDIASADQVDELFVLAAAQSLPAIAVLPRVRTEPQLVEQLLALAGGARWKGFRVPVPGGLQTDDVFVGLEWQTDTPGLWCSPMGLAPLGTMPQTRRAPYTCLVAWTAGRMNKFRKKADRVVHLLDTDLSRLRLDSEKYKEHRRDSERLAKDILVGDDPANYRNVAFRLSSAAADRLRELPELEPDA